MQSREGLDCNHNDWCIWMCTMILCFQGFMTFQGIRIRLSWYIVWSSLKEGLIIQVFQSRMSLRNAYSLLTFKSNCIRRCGLMVSISMKLHSNKPCTVECEQLILTLMVSDIQMYWKNWTKNEFYYLTRYLLKLFTSRRLDIWKVLMLKHHKTCICKKQSITYSAWSCAIYSKVLSWINRGHIESVTVTCNSWTTIMLIWIDTESKC